VAIWRRFVEATAVRVDIPQASADSHQILPWLLLLPALLLLPMDATADVVCALGSGAASYKASEDQRPTSDAMEMAHRLNAALTPICSPMCPQIAVFRNKTAANAMLIVTPDQAKLVYAPLFFQTVYDSYGDGAVVAIIAHEFGHALDEIYPGKFGTGGTPELRADAWAGCALARVNLSSTGLAEALTAMSKYPPPDQPGWNLRLLALRLGYTKCGGDGSKFEKGANGGLK
jgi:hypothetical protein